MFNSKFNKTATRLAHHSTFAPTWAEGVTRSFRRLSLFGAMGALALVLCNQAMAAGKPEVDRTYANGQVFYMNGAHMINHPNQHLWASAEDLYLLAYPINPRGTNVAPLTVGADYTPACDPCYRPGLKPQFAYFDQIVNGAPGMGRFGTAGVYEGPWKVILMMYSKSYIDSTNFAPIESVAGLKDAEMLGNGTVLQAINKNQMHGTNVFEVQTGKVMICPLVSPHA